MQVAWLQRHKTASPTFLIKHWDPHPVSVTKNMLIPWHSSFNQEPISNHYIWQFCHMASSTSPRLQHRSNSHSPSLLNSEASSKFVSEATWLSSIHGKLNHWLIPLAIVRDSNRHRLFFAVLFTVRLFLFRTIVGSGSGSGSVWVWVGLVCVTVSDKPGIWDPCTICTMHDFSTSSQ